MHPASRQISFASRSLALPAGAEKASLRICHIQDMADFFEIFHRTLCVLILPPFRTATQPVPVDGRYIVARGSNIALGRCAAPPASTKFLPEFVLAALRCCLLTTAFSEDRGGCRPLRFAENDMLPQPFSSEATPLLPPFLSVLRGGMHPRLFCQ